MARVEGFLALSQGITKRKRNDDADVWMYTVVKR